LKLYIGKKSATYKWILHVYALIFPFVLFFALEGLNPVTSGFLGLGAIFASACIIAAGALLLYFAHGSVFWAYVPVSAVVLFAYVINYFKFMVTGRVFVFGDLLVAGEALSVMGGSAISINLAFVLRVLLIIILHVPLFFIKFKIVFKKRCILIGLAVIMFLGVFLIPMGAENFWGARTVLYRETGLIMGFRTCAVQNRYMRRKMPELMEYSREFFDDMPEMTASQGAVTPNVIVIMSESFADPTTFGNLDFSVNPVSNFQRLAQNATSGNVIVPVFGGGTVNTELEFLTGTPMYLLSRGYTFPHANPRRYFGQNIYTALPWVFRENGYRAVAVHANYAGFYNRGRVFSSLGFDTFISKEDMPNAPFKGWFVSDEYFTDRMIEQIELAEQAREPLFLFGISAQNHWEFSADKYAGHAQDVTATSPLLTHDQTARVNTYLQGVFDADAGLGRLIEFIESRETPTIVVFFGDHMPIIDSNEDVLVSLGAISAQNSWDWTLADREMVFTTPYLVWDNMGSNADDWGSLSAYFLSAQIARYSGIALNTHWQQVLHLNQHFNGLTENHYLDIYGNFHGIDGVWERSHVRAFAGLVHAKWFD